MRKSTLYWYLNNLRIGQIICVKFRTKIVFYSLICNTYIHSYFSHWLFKKKRDAAFATQLSCFLFLNIFFTWWIRYADLIFFFPVSTSDSLEHVKSLILPMQKPCARSCMRHSHYKMRTKVSLVMCIISNKLLFPISYYFHWHSLIKTSKNIQHATLQYTGTTTPARRRQSQHNALTQI